MVNVSQVEYLTHPPLQEVDKWPISFSHFLASARWHLASARLCKEGRKTCVVWLCWFALLAMVDIRLAFFAVFLLPGAWQMQTQRRNKEQDIYDRIRGILWQVPVAKHRIIGQKMVGSILCTSPIKVLVSQSSCTWRVGIPRPPRNGQSGVWRLRVMSCTDAWFRPCEDIRANRAQLSIAQGS
jgi:hypothetical protein